MHLQVASLNLMELVRSTLFNGCCWLVHKGSPPQRFEDRVINLRPRTELMLEAMVKPSPLSLRDAGVRTITWDHPPSEPPYRVFSPQNN